MVCVTVVTYDSERYIEACLDSVLRQAGIPLEIVVVDNGSTDRTPAILASFGAHIRVIANRRNAGFAAAQNQAIAVGRGQWLLALNPDVVLEPDFTRRLLDAAALDERAGTICGKLYSLSAPGMLDSTGIYFTPEMRHFDRGWHEPDDGRFDRIEYVFGASAAAALYRREMIEDVSVDGCFFDPDFFTYREDADVAWRAQLLGWRCLYTPEAIGRHFRRAEPDNRGSVPAVLNMHSVKNRFLMRAKNATTGVYRRFWLPMLARDAVVIGGCLFWEPSSLPALWLAARSLPRALAQRRHIMARRRTSDSDLIRWFNPEPSAEPVHGEPVAAAVES